MHPDKVVGRDEAATKFLFSLQQESESWGVTTAALGSPAHPQGSEAACAGCPMRVPSVRAWVSGILPPNFWTTPPAAQLVFFSFVVKSTVLASSPAADAALSVPPPTYFSPVVSLSPPEQPILY